MRQRLWRTHKEAAGGSSGGARLLRRRKRLGTWRQHDSAAGQGRSAQQAAEPLHRPAAADCKGTRGAERPDGLRGSWCGCTSISSSRSGSRCSSRRSRSRLEVAHGRGCDVVQPVQGCLVQRGDGLADPSTVLLLLLLIGHLRVTGVLNVTQGVCRGLDVHDVTNVDIAIIIEPLAVTWGHR